MFILALTTSTDEGSVALTRGAKVVAKRSWNRVGQHSEVLTFNVQAVLKKAKVSPESLNLIAVDIGPGSFTGCRLAVNVARTMAYGLNLPIFTAHSLDILAQAVSENFEGMLFTGLNAHKSLLYSRSYKISKHTAEALTPIAARSLDEVIRMAEVGTLAVGDIPKEFMHGLKEKGCHFLKAKKYNWPQATALAQIAAGAATSEYLGWQQVEPSYVRVPDVVEKNLNLRAHPR